MPPLQCGPRFWPCIWLGLGGVRVACPSSHVQLWCGVTLLGTHSTYLARLSPWATCRACGAYLHPQEALAMVGILPAVVQYAAPHHSTAVRYQVGKLREPLLLLSPLRCTLGAPSSSPAPAVCTHRGARAVLCCAVLLFVPLSRWPASWSSCAPSPRTSLPLHCTCSWLVGAPRLVPHGPHFSLFGSV